MVTTVYLLRSSWAAAAEEVVDQVAAFDSQLAEPLITGTEVAVPDAPDGGLVARICQIAD